jgi:putative ABC transport system permease protein
MLREVVQDLRYAWRTATKSPGFVATAIATLAVGIGATVGIFTVVNAILLRPLPISKPEELVVVSAQNVTTHATVSASWTKYQLVRDENHVFSDVAAWAGREIAFSDGTTPEQVNGARVTWNFFDVLGVTPAAGRTFRSEEDIENAAPVAMVTDSYIQRRFGGDSSAVIGRSVTIEGRATTIVGTLPPGFRYEFTDREPQIYLTSVFTPGVMTAAQIQHGAGFLGYIGRLRPGVAIGDVAKDLASIDARYRERFGSYVDATRFALHAVPLTESVVGDVRAALLVLMGAVALVLLIACANVAHLLLARAAARQHEIAVRLAIGASRSRVIRQLLTESVLLSLAGCVVGWWALSLVIDLLVTHAPANIPRLRETHSDLTVLVFATAVSLMTGVLFGITPALRATRVRAGDVLKDTRREGRTSGMTRRLHHLLAISETAVTLALLIAGGLLFQSFHRMQRVDVGFQPAAVYAAHISLPRGKYAEPPQRERFFTQLLDRARQQPGLGDVGAISYLPMSGSNYGFIFYREESPDRDNPISVRHVGGDYFRAMQIPLRRGRTFTDRDDGRAMPVAIINESTARHYFADADPLGRRVASTSDRVLREIVGVVADVRFDNPARSGQDELYVPYKQIPWPAMTIVVRSTLAPGQVIATLRREVALLDREQAVADIRPVTAIVAASMARQEFTSGLFAVFAILATTLAVVGLYGVMTLFVSERRREFGIRMALGARPVDLVRLVMREGVWMVGIGAAVGILAALALRQAVSSLLFGITASDPTTYTLATAIVCAVGLIACYVPVRRAVALDPVHALRS